MLNLSGATVLGHEQSGTSNSSSGCDLFVGTHVVELFADGGVGATLKMYEQGLRVVNAEALLQRTREVGKPFG